MSEVNVEVTLAQHDIRIAALERLVTQQQEQNEFISDLRVEIGKLQMQIKITWALLVMVLTGLVGVAFSLWQGGGP